MTTLSSYTKNPYKPWKCVTCTEKYCYDCDKVFPEDHQESISCDKCSFWYHLHCTDLTLDKFKFHSDNPSARWICKKCTRNFCKKCGTSVYHKPRITCCVCHYTYHFYQWWHVSKFPKRLHSIQSTIQFSQVQGLSLYRYRDYHLYPVYQTYLFLSINIERTGKDLN